VIALLRATVEAERVLETRAAASLDGDPQNLCVAPRLVGLELLDLRGRALGERDDGGGLFEGGHGPIVAVRPAPPNRRSRTTL
jgi:hypothetical protein